MNTHVRAHDRAKPSKPQVYIDLHQKLKAEVKAKARADKAVNEFRASIGCRPTENALTVIVGKLRALARELVS